MHVFKRLFEPKKTKQTYPEAPKIIIHGPDTLSLGSLEVNTTLTGDFYARERLVVSAEASITGHIFAHEGEVAGRVSGNISCLGNLYIGPTAWVQGDIQASCLEVARGAQINGHISLLRDSQAIEHLLNEKLQLAEQMEGRKGTVPNSLAPAQVPSVQEAEKVPASTSVKPTTKPSIPMPSNRPHTAASDDSASWW